MKAKAESSNTPVDDAARTVRWDNDIVENSQRCLAFLEALVARCLISYEAGYSITAAEAKRVRSMLEVGETDLKCLWWVLRAAKLGDKDAVECIKKARQGKHKTGESAYTSWQNMKRTALKKLEEKEPKGKSKPQEARPTKHPQEGKIDAAINRVSENRLLTSDGQIALALVEALLESGVYSLEKEAMRGTNSVIAEKIKPLKLAISEVGTCLTLLRSRPDLIDGIRSGAASAQWTLSYLVHGRSHGRLVKKPKDEDQSIFEAPNIDLDGFDLGSFVESAQERVKAASEKKDLAHALSELLAAANSGLDAIRLAASESKDQEVLDIARKAQTEISATKMTAAHLVTNRAEDKAYTARQADKQANRRR